MEPTNPTGLLVAAQHPGRDRLVAAIGAVGALLVFLSHRTTPVTATGLVIVVAVSTWLSIIDFREHRLPNRIVGPLAVAVAAAVLIGSLADGDPWRGGRSVGFGLAVTAVLLLANVFGGMGMGDVKYGFPWATTIGWFGWPSLSVAIMITTISGAVVAGAVLISKRSRDERLSYGPYMALGLIAGLLAAAP